MTAFSALSNSKTSANTLRFAEGVALLVAAEQRARFDNAWIVAIRQ
jgi:hypothetical protein